ncbi:MAG: glycoside hydrolase family 3 N-terminal domain-containing protein [Lachnospiraceae bacterium]
MREGRKYNASSAENDRDIYRTDLLVSNVNIFRDPRWGRGHETYGEDPYLTSRLGVAFVEGLQGDGDTLKAAACAKHFAVHSGPEALRHEFDAQATPQDMEETYLPAFQALVQEAGVESVMALQPDRRRAMLRKSVSQKILRKDWDLRDILFLTAGRSGTSRASYGDEKCTGICSDGDQQWL